MGLLVVLVVVGSSLVVGQTCEHVAGTPRYLAPEVLAGGSADRGETRYAKAARDFGRRVAEACGRNLVPAKLELGGKGAARFI